MLLQSHTNGIIMHDFIYAGPSWAVQSFETPGGDDAQKVNIGDMFAQEYNLSALRVPKMGVSNGWLCEQVRRSGASQDTPIIWVYCEPLGKLYHKRTEHDMAWPCYLEQYQHTVAMLLTRDDWRQYRSNIADSELAEMNSLGHPIGIVGSHADILPEQVADYENLTVIEPSWQQILASHCRITAMPEHIGVDFIHQTIKIYAKDEKIFNYIKQYNLSRWMGYEEVKGAVCRGLMKLVYGDQVPEPYEHVNADVIQTIHEHYEYWKQFEEAGVWSWVHPNIRGNEIFYRHVKTKLKGFIDAYS